MNKQEKLIVALTSVISTLEKQGCAGIFKTVELKDGTKEKIECIDEIKNYIDTNLSCENYEFEELKELNNAINHCNNVIKELKNKANCDGCLKDHQQLKKWLIRYKNTINPSPYKSEDLKVGMWIWDNQIKGVIQVKKILTKKYCKYLYHDKNKKVFIDEFGAIEFEENRFYPVTKAIQYQNNK